MSKNAKQWEAQIIEMLNELRADGFCVVFGAEGVQIGKWMGEQGEQAEGEGHGG